MTFPIFVINLDKDVDRLVFIRNQFNKHNVPISRFPAITPGDLSADMWKLVDYSRIKAKYGYDFRPGEVACAFSHKAILENIVAKEIPIALILEDDVLLDDLFFIFLNNLQKDIAREVHPKWEYLHCNYHIMDSINFSRFYKETYRRILGKGFLSSFLGFMKIIVGCIVFLFDKLLMFYGYIFGPRGVYPIRPYYMAGTYFITLNGAKKILQTMNETIIAPADDIQNLAKHNKNLRISLLIPQLSVQQTHFPSNTLSTENY